MDNTDKAGKGIRYIDNRNKNCKKIGYGDNNYECSIEFRHIDKNDKYSKEIRKENRKEKSLPQSVQIHINSVIALKGLGTKTTVLKTLKGLRT